MRAFVLLGLAAYYLTFTGVGACVSVNTTTLHPGTYNVTVNLDNDRPCSFFLYELVTTGLVSLWGKTAWSTFRTGTHNYGLNVSNVTHYLIKSDCATYDLHVVRLPDPVVTGRCPVNHPWLLMVLLTMMGCFLMCYDRSGGCQKPPELIPGPAPVLQVSEPEVKVEAAQPQ